MRRPHIVLNCVSLCARIRFRRRAQSTPAMLHGGVNAPQERILHTDLALRRISQEMAAPSGLSDLKCQQVVFAVCAEGQS